MNVVRKLSMIALALVILLTACAPNFQKQDEVVQEENDSTQKKAIIPKYKVSDKYYQTILPFEPSEARGLVVNNIDSRYDLSEFETGLMRIAQNNFDADKYLFQEGQYLDKNTVRLWLNRKFTDSQLKEEGLKASENIGLNPLNPGKSSSKSSNEKYPIYLAHILEHNYLVKDDKGTVKLGGVVIGLAMNSVYYYQTVKYGPTYEKKIDHAKVEKEGKKIAEEVVKRLRKIKGLKTVPITIALFEQEKRSSVVPGNFFAYAHASKGSSNIEDWKKVKEEYVLFPSDTSTEKYRENDTAFKNFKQDVEDYFPNFNGIIGKGFYVDSQLQELSIDIPIQFYGKTEAVGFTQYVAGLVMEYFPNYITVQVSITSVNGPEALIVRKAKQDEPFVHIYQ